jgi:ubiquinone/menaquinone biosynthesis C-methylase UbiE
MPALVRFSGAKEYAELYRGNTPVAEFFHERMMHVDELLKSIPGGRLLDVGCGPGILLDHLAGRGFELFGVDLSQAMIAEAACMTVRDQPRLAVAGIEALPYADATFNVVLVLGVLEYVHKLEVALREIARVSHPNAIVIISMLNRGSIYWRWRLHIYEKVRQRLFGSAGQHCFCQELNLYDRSHLDAALMQVGLKVQKTLYYNFNLGLEPLATRCPRFVSRLNALCQTVLRHRLSDILRTAFLLCAIYRPDA